MPLDQFELGFKRPVMDAPLRLVERYPRDLRSYLVEHIRPVAPDGRPWQVRVDDLQVEEDSGPGHVDLVARLTLTPPPGAPVRRFHLDYSVINHEVMTHTVLVFARSDWENGVMAAEPELLGTVRWLTTGIDVDRQQGSFWTGFKGVFQLGMEHIAGGADHLLFLLTLLLPAPLSRGGSRWGSYVGSRTTIIRLATLVTAFTVGHSLTLMVGALGNVAVPSQPVEVAIAVSILVSALHAWRPLLHGREAWVAAGFGLLHGLAFSQVIAGGELEGWNKAAAVLGFNLGIEAVQLLIVALVAPCLIVLARAGAYTPLRLAGAVLAAVASLAWAWERVTGQPNAISGSLDSLLAAGPWLFFAVALCAMLSALAGKARKQSPQIT